MVVIKSKSFVEPSDPVLIKVADEVSLEELKSHEFKSILEQMLKVGYGQQLDGESKPVLVGLAAPQIGIPKRVVLVDVIADGKGTVGDLRIFINPTFTPVTQEMERGAEGCFSTDRVAGIVSRFTNIRVTALNVAGETIHEEYQGLTARIFQHEIDHLNGLEFTTHIDSDDDLHWVEDGEFPLYRKNDLWKSWPKKCPRERWNAIKAGRWDGKF